ncbi:hypothetical protein [Flexivirga caeni]|uniref:Uncharacterized protein n=1 Tax=Flexivirga caeni TaxID=2294115 RepID=A0A3M9MDQ9_9MICO|nr:hypothetical protein [Flexivirga caeni]RNI23277.1 hypothetical protein EFY87_07580 [Flexivirga caeni]
MTATAEDPDLLLRAARRCRALAAVLAAVESALLRCETASWSGAAAVAFVHRAAAHRRSVSDALCAVERLGALVAAYARTVQDEQVRQRQADLPDAARAAIDHRITLQRSQFRRDLAVVESALADLRLRLTTPGDGHRHPPPGRTNPPPRRLPPERWKGPIIPPQLPRPRRAHIAPVVCARSVRGGPA